MFSNCDYYRQEMSHYAFVMIYKTRTMAKGNLPLPGNRNVPYMSKFKACLPKVAVVSLRCALNNEAEVRPLSHSRYFARFDRSECKVHPCCFNTFGGWQPV